MACGCNKKASNGWVWKSADGTQSQDYRTEVEAHARAIRDGGTWGPK
jgi:hypothetical protein